MLGDVFVVDAVVHGYHFDARNRVPEGARFAEAVSNSVYGFHTGYSPVGEPLITHRQMDNSHDAHFLAQMLFAESHADATVFHGLPMFGWFRDGGSPLAVAREMRERYPGRVLVYGPVSPHQPGALESIDRMVEEDQVVGIKIYPVDLVGGELRSVAMNDLEIAYPLFERAQQLGIKVVAVHKAVPMGPVPLAPYRPDDIDEASQAFPDLTFEVVHGGFAFLEETALQMARFPNVCVNLEGTSALLVRAPRKFARILAEIMRFGGGDRIIWGTGSPVVHPRSFEEAMWDLEMPADLVAEEGIPELTDEVKRGILGGNILRILGIDQATLLEQSASDEFVEPRELAPRWSSAETLPDEVAS